ncbi:MAG: AbrB/MazE/SpoVT family DNA-binding domain-containing protein [Candidatus Contubernalis sp.]|nr:AbrB/MazE/SpoVT family DNA-binding domain-containing protein [Candidatus Contubernalis sp.]
MEIRKIFRAGNSQVVTIPAKILKELNLEEGDHVTLEMKGKDKSLIIRPLQEKISGGDEFFDQVEDFLDNYKEALDKLEK